MATARSISWTSETPATDSADHGPWNPGIRSQLPPALRPLATIYRPENVLTSLEEVDERSAFTGLEPEEHVAFRPERLAVHETLIRVTADISVPDGQQYEDLGINFREITRTILSRHVEPRVAEIVRAHEDLRRRASGLVDQELSSGLFASPGATSTDTGEGSLLRFLGLGRKQEPRHASTGSVEDRELRILAQWRQKAESADDALARSMYRALARLGSAIRVRHGRLIGDRALLAPLTVDMICNEHGSEAIGRIIDPWIRRAAEEEGFRLLPPQERPVVMNVKGASASGKSTMRPLQRKLAEEIGVRWSDFALVSPDIWRKYLLDYDSLGAASKYAGTFTGLELAIVDQKLDRYMAQKANRGEMSHLLIDRFRFDSFAEDSDEEDGSKLLTRFGHVVHMFFMITPPHATVERAWLRGRQVGRYKAVDDLLDHNVEAYTGMPRLFFTWASRKDKSVFYEFLDNSVPDGQRPRTVAFGSNEAMKILDMKCLIDVDRYRKINIDARCPEEVYPDAGAMAPEQNTEFLKECVRRIPSIELADHETGIVYARLQSGELSWTDPVALTEAIGNPETRAGFLALAPNAMGHASKAQAEPRSLDRSRSRTLGEWGGAQQTPIEGAGLEKAVP
jgi:hypothetical protein